MSPPVFLVESLPPGDRIRLGGPEGHHAATVRRITAGERVDLSDGAGEVAECVVLHTDPDGLQLSIEVRRTVPAPDPVLVVVQALPKGDRGELAVELMTEAGVDEIVPWAASHSIGQWRGARGDRSLARWRAVGREAAKQSRRSRLPIVADLHSTREVCAVLAAADTALALHETARLALTAVVPARTGRIVLVVGPEGGLADGELTVFRAAGARVVRLGPDVFRTSTAGVAALAVLSATIGRWA